MSEDKFLNKYRIPSARAPWHGYDGGAYFITICTHNRQHYFGEIVDETSAIVETCDFDNVETRDFDNVETCDFDNVETRDFDNVETRRATSLPGEPQMILSPIGQYAHDQFANVTEHYPYAEIPLFVIMPNHIHAIVLIDGGKTPYQRRCETDKGNCIIAAPSDNCGDAAPVGDCRDAASVGDCRDAAPVGDCRDAASVGDCRDAASVGDCRDAACHVSTMREIANMQGWLSVVIGGIKSSITKFARENNIPFAWQTRFHDRIIRNQNGMNRSAKYIEQNIANWQDDEFCQ